ncbi:MAG: PilZ domain-containing protein [Treponema sp.]|nr:PilZ domain-containing protein [Treponema sp.]
MATPIKRIEKEFLLKVLHDEQIPIIYLKGQTQHTFVLEKPAKGQMVFKADRPVEGLKLRKKLGLMFDYRGQVTTFSVEVSDFKDDHIVTSEPESLYKNLERSFSRVSSSPNLEVQFTFSSDRYSLSYPKIDEYEKMDEETFMDSVDPKNLSGLIEQMAAWIKGHASGYKLIIFKDVKPASMEEQILAETGRAFYLPSVAEGFPDDDPYPQKRLVTADVFKRFLEGTGVDLKLLDNVCARFLEQKHENGVISDLWMPILFQEYVIGYVHIWINTGDKPPFGYEVIDTLYQFSKILANSLKVNGYFEAGKIKNEPFEGKIIDISASGILFSYPNSPFASALMPNSELLMKLISPRRTVSANALIVRRYKDAVNGYFGCRFVGMAPEDLRFLFEYIYGKPFTDSDATFLSGQV